MKEQGYTLVELAFVMVLVGLIGMSIHIGCQLIEKVKFEQTVGDVARGVEEIKHRAVLTGKQYNLVCLDNRILLREGAEKPFRKIYLGKDMYFPNTKEMTGEEIRFKWSVVPSQTGTIVICDKMLKQKGCIAVGVASGRVRVYYEAL